MSGKLPINNNQYFSIDQTITNEQGTVSRPFRLTRLLDIVRNDGPDEAVVSLDGGASIPLLAGDYIEHGTDSHARLFQCHAQLRAGVAG